MSTLARWLGLTDASGPFYLWWSGVGSDLAYVGALWVLFKRVNCHVRRCPRIALHKVPDSPYSTCRKHYPAPLPAKVSAAHIRLHRERHRR